MAERDSHRRELLEVLEGLTTGVLLVKADTRVTFMNTAAQRLVRRRDGLLVDRVGIAASRARDTVALRALIARAATTSSREGFDAGGVVRIPRARSRHPLEIVVS